MKITIILLAVLLVVFGLVSLKKSCHKYRIKDMDPNNVPTVCKINNSFYDSLGIN